MYETPYEVEQRQADKAAIAHRELMADFAAALECERPLMLRTPAWATKSQTLTAVVEDEFAGRDGDKLLDDLLWFVRQALKSPDPLLRLKAQAWTATVGRLYADQHCDAAVPDEVGA